MQPDTQEIISEIFVISGNGGAACNQIQKKHIRDIRGICLHAPLLPSISCVPGCVLTLYLDPQCREMIDLMAASGESREAAPATN